MKFSQRIGKTPIVKAIQFESADLDLRIVIGNALHILFWAEVMERYSTRTSHPDALRVCSYMWSGVLKKRLDEMPEPFSFAGGSCHSIFKDYLTKCEWWEVYDFVEEFVKAQPTRSQDHFRSLLNIAFEREGSAYRFVGDEIAAISDSIEITAIETATKVSDEAATHLDRALALEPSDKTAVGRFGSIEQDDVFALRDSFDRRRTRLWRASCFLTTCGTRSRVAFPNTSLRRTADALRRAIATR